MWEGSGIKLIINPKLQINYFKLKLVKKLVKNFCNYKIKKIIF